MNRTTFFAALLVLLGAASSALAADYAIDTAHSSVSFQVRHILTKVNGRFDKFEGTFSFAPAESKGWKTNATVDVESINTNNADRDKHLRSADFFDVDNAKHPEFKTMTFKSKKVTDVAGNRAKLHGDLSIHGVTKSVVFDLEILGTGKDPWGTEKAAFSASTTVNRKDFGLGWNKVLETGGLLVGEEVEIRLDVEGNRAKKP